MQNYDTGEEYPCPRCGRLDCNGVACKPTVVPEPKVDISGVEMNDTMKNFLRAGSGQTSAPQGEQQTNEGSTPSPSTFTVEEFKEASRFFGKKGGNVTKLRGSEYYSKIAKLSWEKRRHENT